MNGGQQLVTCPKCGGSKVTPLAGGIAAGIGLILAGLFFGIGLGMWIPIIGWFIMIPAGIVMMIIGAITVVSSILIKLGRKKPTHKKFMCNDKECHHKFKVAIETAKEYEAKYI
jgi:hypothetical protein